MHSTIILDADRKEILSSPTLYKLHGSLDRGVTSVGTDGGYVPTLNMPPIKFKIVGVYPL